MIENVYQPSEVVDVGTAQATILGEKQMNMVDTVMGDPDIWHRPEALADREE